MQPDCGRRPGSVDELASLGLDSGPRRPASPLDPGEGRLRRSVRPRVSPRAILSIGLAQNTGQAKVSGTNAIRTIQAQSWNVLHDADVVCTQIANHLINNSVGARRSYSRRREARVYHLDQARIVVDGS